MTVREAGREVAEPRRPELRERALHLVAGLAVLVGVLATVLRPLVPDLGPPADPTRWFGPDYLARAAEYRHPRYVAAGLALALRIAVPCLVAFTPAGRRLVGRIVDRLGGRRVAAPVTVVLMVVVVTDLLVLPIAFWMGYVHDGLYGFRNQGPGGWARDWLVSTGPPWALVALLTAGGWWLAGRFPRTWPAVGGLGAAALLVVVVGASPLLLEPLEHRTTPLAAGQVRDAVEAVIDRSGHDVSEIVVADASRRSIRQNAYVSGLGATRRIVLYDTLVQGQSPAVVAQVVAHEIAHDRHGDVVRGTLLGAAGIILAAYALKGVLAWRVARARQGDETDPRSAAVALAVVVVIIVAAYPVQNLVSREYEAAADLGALEITRDPATYREQRLAMTRANLADPSPPLLVRLLWSSHPSAVERLEMGEQWPLEWRGPIRR